ncbi:hypothetical protein [Algoriphagus aquimarinus]|mgnify:CR=1 FL=1|uniref:hypothetical protein n=1 Tax=Algoriphagus aquimarinus TaxID=237018 RepID=UPI0030DDB7B3|tara:strand:- start:33822 stop:34016 length:195 start_codon:yes stop_codon:yes gene_type:complete
MSFQYIKKNKHKNEGVFVPLTEGEDLSENPEKVEGEDDTVEDWNRIVATKQKEKDHEEVSKKEQ